MNVPVRSRFWSGFGLTDFYLLGMVLLWGMNFVIVKRALAEIQPLAFNSLRFVLASLILLAMLVPKGVFRLPRRAFWQCLLVGAVGNGLYQIVFIEGLARTSAGNSALILATSPIFIALFSVMKKHDRPGRLGWIGIVMSFLGVGLIIWKGSGIDFRGELAGDLLTVLAAIFWATYTVGLRSLVLEFGLLRITAMTMSLGTVPLLMVGIPSLVTQRWTGLSWVAWRGLAYSALGSIVLGYLVWNYGVKKIGGTRTGVYSNLTPVVAILFAWIALSETQRITQIFGATLIFVSITLTRKPHHHPRETIGSVDGRE